ncbi:hypothetical protein TA3x_000986 [Tundrisphaera sp. TA3]|uniref:hypothetical protein n=1 Tax=Tundrisphaera sp. TA3 TaxID=3435775 RepID=UPI003EBB23CD
MHLEFLSPMAWNSTAGWMASGSFLGYLDPGTGSYALQMLLAGLFGGMFALKQSWAALRAWFSARRGTSVSLAGAAAGLGHGNGHRLNHARPRLHGQPNPNDA